MAELASDDKPDDDDMPSVSAYRYESSTAHGSDMALALALLRGEPCEECEATPPNSSEVLLEPAHANSARVSSNVLWSLFTGIFGNRSPPLLLPLVLSLRGGDWLNVTRAFPRPVDMVAAAVAPASSAFNELMRKSIVVDKPMSGV
jgi:hypothetical protein